MRLGNSLLICGAGPIGLAVLLCARAAGATPIVITDIDESRLKFAKDLVPSVETFVVPRSGEESEPTTIAAALKEKHFGELGPEVCIECTGFASSIATAVHAAIFGGTVFVIGLGKDLVEVPIMTASKKEVDLRFQHR